MPSVAAPCQFFSTPGCLGCILLTSTCHNIAHPVSSVQRHTTTTLLHSIGSCRCTLFMYALDPGQFPCQCLSDACLCLAPHLSFSQASLACLPLPFTALHSSQSAFQSAFQDAFHSAFPVCLSVCLSSSSNLPFQPAFQHLSLALSLTAACCPSRMQSTGDGFWTRPLTSVVCWA